MAVVVTTAVTSDGGREILDLDVGNSEDEVFWCGFFRTLKQSGLRGTPSSLPASPRSDRRWMLREPRSLPSPRWTDQPKDPTPRSRRRHSSQRGGVIRLVGAVLNDLHDEWRVSDRRYSSEGSMAKIKPSPRDIELVAAIEADD